ncbi:MAG: integrase [Pelagibacterium sp. SCN 63-23]|nr:MAG: integrase [Pelagibacterium sp. SCN 63-23]
MTDIRVREDSKGQKSYQVRYAKGGGKFGYRSFKTRREAKTFLESGGVAEARASGAARPAIRTVAQGLQKWLDVCEKEGRSGRDPVTGYTLKTYRYRADIIESYDWNKDLQDLTAPDVVEFRSWLTQNHSRDQARKVLSYFHSMVLELVHRGIIKHDIAAGIRIVSTSRYDEEVDIPSVSDVRALLKAADDLAASKNAQIAKTWERYRPILYLAADSGMRPQEYLVMSRAGVSERGVTVDRALDAGGKKISVTKTAAGRRFIDLNDTTLNLLDTYMDLPVGKNPHDLVFPTSNGSWVSTNNWRRRGFVVACEKAGLIDAEIVDGKEVAVPRYKPYDLRHFYASMLIEKKLSLKRIQKLMGHADIQTTLNVYGHLIEKAEEDDTKGGGILGAITPRRKPTTPAATTPE